MKNKILKQFLSLSLRSPDVATTETAMHRQMLLWKQLMKREMLQEQPMKTKIPQQ